MPQSLVIGVVVVAVLLAVWIAALILVRRTRGSGSRLTPEDADAARDAARAGDAAQSTAMANRIREGRRGV